MAPLPPATLLGVCLAVCAVSVVLVRTMRRLGTLDTPGERSSHVVPTPKGGGVGIVVGFLAGLACVAALGGVAHAGVLAVSAVLVSAFSYADDVHSLPAWAKLGVQAAAAGLLALGGLSATPLGWLVGPVVAAGWYVLAMNAVNFMDGLNGLAAGSTAVACLALSLLFPELRTLGLLGVAAIAGFLPFNYPRASIFMGDVGSQFCGLLVAALGVLAAMQAGTVAALLCGPFLLSGMLFDVLYTLLRRFLAGERLFHAHRTHLYQWASRSGLPAALVSLLHWGFVAWGAGCFALWRAGSPAAAIVLLAIPQLAWLFAVVLLTRRAGLPPPLLHRPSGRVGMRS